MDNNKLNKQIDFILEMDKLKTIFRKSFILDTDRRENDAEHSWHLAVMAMVLQEYSNRSIDVFHVIKMLLLHDVVEIDAGDTFLYDEKLAESKLERENDAADRIFALLPDAQCDVFKDLWLEFETGITTEAKFAKSLDRLMPLLHNYYSGGKTWIEFNVTKKQVLEKNKKFCDGSIELWEFAKSIIDKSVEKGYLSE